MADNNYYQAFRYFELCLEQSTKGLGESTGFPVKGNLNLWVTYP